VHQSWVLQALFIDWLFYDDKANDQIMLVEPGMLLMYKSTDKRSWITDMLVEYLYNLVRNYHPGRVDESLKSV
jgi:integrator complex subunit 3